VLTREKFRPFLSPSEAATAISLLARVAELHADPREASRISPDPDDDYLIALAGAAGVEYLVSGGPTWCSSPRWSHRSSRRARSSRACPDVLRPALDPRPGGRLQGASHGAHVETPRRCGPRRERSPLPAWPFLDLPGKPGLPPLRAAEAETSVGRAHERLSRRRQVAGLRSW
jgi:hypothetical protein